MKLFAMLICFILLAGCEMSTEQITKKLAECQNAGLHADVYRMFGDSKVVDIQCVPKRENKS